MSTSPFQWLSENFWFLVSVQAGVIILIPLTWSAIEVFHRRVPLLAVVWRHLAVSGAAAVAYVAIGFRLMYGESPFEGFGMGDAMNYSVEMDLLVITDLLVQSSFAIVCAILAVLGVGARDGFAASVFFGAIVGGIIYPLFGGWVWGLDGWLASLGFFDYSGGMVLYGMAASLAFGAAWAAPRGRPEIPDLPVNPWAKRGAIAGVLFFCFPWDFMAAAQPSTLVVMKLLVTNGVACGILGAVFSDFIFGRSTNLRTVLHGALASLAALAAGFDLSALPLTLFLAFVSGVAYTSLRELLRVLKIDDPADVVATFLPASLLGTTTIALFEGGPPILAQLAGAATGLGIGFAAGLVFGTAANSWKSRRADES